MSKYKPIAKTIKLDHQEEKQMAFLADFKDIVIYGGEMGRDKINAHLLNLKRHLEGFNNIQSHTEPHE